MKLRPFALIRLKHALLHEVVVAVVIVEDEDDIREMIGGILQDEGYETRLAATSEEAIAEVKLRKPSLIVLDVWLKAA